ncbi:hypothetical protein RMCBS344292_17136 [Rhizopus microsporus]|nr:hypothetical protein RMCBS344292_17136 [Rhizopus microsporus]
MSDYETDMRKAMAESLSHHLQEQEKENDDLKKAIAASLGKTVEQLTARDLLLATDSVRKRQRSEDQSSIVTTKRVDTSNSKYWDGTVKLTYVKGFTGPNYIKLSDIVQRVIILHNVSPFLNQRL